MNAKQWYDDDVKRSAAERDYREIERAIRSVTCPEHGVHAEPCRSHIDQSSKPHLVVQVGPCCCDKLRNAAEQARTKALSNLAA